MLTQIHTDHWHSQLMSKVKIKIPVELRSLSAWICICDWICSWCWDALMPCLKSRDMWWSEKVLGFVAHLQILLAVGRLFYVFYDVTSNESWLSIVQNICTQDVFRPLDQLCVKEGVLLKKICFHFLSRIIPFEVLKHYHHHNHKS